MKNDIKQITKEEEIIRLYHLIHSGLTYTKIHYMKTAGVELKFNKRRHRRIQKILKNQLKKMEV